MKHARTRWERGAGLAAALCLAVTTSCASIRPVRDVIRPEDEAQSAGESGAAGASEAPATGDADASSGSAPAGSAAAGGAGTGDRPRSAGPGGAGAGASDGSDDASEEVEEDRGEAPAELPSRAELRAMLADRLEAADERCNGLLDALDEAGEDATYEQLIEASRALVFNADLRIQNDVAFRFEPDDLPDVEVLIGAEDDVSSELKSDVRSLAKSSRDLAAEALERREGDPAGRLFSTLGTGLFLWSLGPLEALANGAATTLPRRVKSLAEDHPEFEGASPLRLKGRFQSRAPWPYKDVDGGVETLTRAVEVAPIPLNLLFLGDAHWLDGSPEPARDAWRRAMRADADEETKAAAPALREIARLRLLASEDDG